MFDRNVAERVSCRGAWYRPDELSDRSRILLIDLQRRDLHIDERGLDLRMSHQLHECWQADAGTHHIRGKGVPETMRVGNVDAGGPAMMAKQTSAIPRGSSGRREQGL